MAIPGMRSSSISLVIYRSMSFTCSGVSLGEGEVPLSERVTLDRHTTDMRQSPANRRQLPRCIKWLMVIFPRALASFIARPKNQMILRGLPHRSKKDRTLRADHSTTESGGKNSSRPGTDGQGRAQKEFVR